MQQGTGCVSGTNGLKKHINTATQLYIIVWGLLQVKCRSLSANALISYGLSKYLGDHPSRTLKKLFAHPTE